MNKSLLILLPFLYCLILLFQQDISFTQDLGRHIKTGEIIVESLSVPATNFYSYTNSNFPIVNHHWGSEVIFYFLNSSLGPASLLVLKVILILLSFGIVFLIAYKKNPFWATLASFPFLYIFSYRFYVRPELFSFLFISLFIYLILKYQETKKFLFLLLLIPITILWVNIHIYFIIGLLLYGCFVIAKFIKDRKIDYKSLLIFAALVLTTLINPQGAKGALEPLTILSAYGYTIVENQSVFFLNQFFFRSQIFTFEVMGILFLVLVLINIKKTNLFLAIAGIASTILAYKMVRNFPIFVLVAFIPFAHSVRDAFVKFTNDKNGKTVKFLISLFIGGFAIFTAFSSITSPISGFGYYKGAERAVEYLKKEKLKGPIFNNFDIGGYLIYRLYPKESVFVDARPEAYPVEFLAYYKKIQENQNEFKKAQEKYKFNTIFFSHTDATPWAQAFLSKISKDKNWKQVYLDEFVVIFVKNI